MSILVRFEDKYGAYDIANYYMDFKKYNNSDVVILNNLGIQNVFTSDVYMNDDEVKDIIFIYDMDRLNQKFTYLDSESFKDIIYRTLKECGAHKRLYFIPVVFCSETILLHKLDTSIDFSQKFSCTNTASMHTKCLSDKLERLHSKDDSKYYRYTGMWSDELNRKVNANLKVKHTHLFMTDGEELSIIYNILKEKNYSKYNKNFFNWVLRSDIKDLTGLLNIDDAIKLQKSFASNIKTAIECGNTGLFCDSIQYS